MAQAAMGPSFNEAVLRQSPSAIANRSYATDEDIERALEEGFRQGVAQAMSDGIITRDEEERLRRLRVFHPSSPAPPGGPGGGPDGRDHVGHHRSHLPLGRRFPLDAPQEVLHVLVLGGMMGPVQ